MMQKTKKTMLPVLVSAMAIVALAMTPALAKDSKNKQSSHSSAKAAAEATGHVSEQSDAPKAGHQDSQPGPAWKTIGGTVKNVHGDIYTVEDYEGNQVKLRVGQGTKHIHKKKIGDTVRAEITRGGFANSIQ
jgi:ribosomal protein L21E